MFLILIKIVYVFLHCLIGVYDFSFYRIPHLFLGILVVLYGVYAPFYLEGGEIVNSLIVFAVVLLLGFGFYALKFFGAGDAKYLAVASLWVGMQGVVFFVLLVAVIGGALALLYLAFRDYIARFSDWVWSRVQALEDRYPFYQYVWLESGRGTEKGKRENISSRAIPYGIAIAVGAILMMTLNPEGF